MTSHAATLHPIAEPRLAGLGGWLILPATGLVLGAVVSTVGLLACFAIFSRVAAAGFGGVFALEILVMLGFLVFSLYTATRFFARRKDTPDLMIGLLLAVPLSSGVLLVIALAAGASDFAASNAADLVRSLLSAAIWIPYFKSSRRVQATFVN